jgi:hypothetical protein
MNKTLEYSTISTLKTRLRGQIILQHDELYDQARHVWNGRIDRYPFMIVRCLDVSDVVTCLRIECGGFYAVADVERVPPESAWCPRSKMTFAEAVSRSSSHPHTQECQRSSKVFLRIVPQLGQVCDVFEGFTKTTIRPALAALTTTICVNALHPASKIDEFKPAFAAAPLSR